MAANTITSQTLLDGEDRLIVKIHIEGFAAGADETDTILVNASAFSPVPRVFSIMEITFSSTGFALNLIWDGATNANIIHLPEGEDVFDFRHFGGLQDNSTTPTGDILMTTNGLTTAADIGTIILDLKKKF